MGDRQYIIIVGAGKVGWNLARELIEKGNEVTLIESNRERYLTVEQELEHNIQYGDASELWVLERAGISRADMVIAVTGDDEDNMLICQVAKEKYLVDRIIARVNNPRNREHFDLLGIKPVVSATDLILRLIEHEVPEYGLVHLLDLPEQRLEIIEMELPANSRAAGTRVGDLAMPEGSLLISVLRDDTGFVPNAETVLQAGRRDPRGPRPAGGGGPDRVLRARWQLRQPADFLIVGGGLAAAYCASELRKQGADGSILLAGREPEPPYERPPLSKEYLRGEASREDAYVNPAEWYEENGVELRTRTNVMSIDPEARTAKLQGGEEVRVRARRCSPPGRTSTSCGPRAPSSRGSTTCARSATPTRSARRRPEAERVVLIGGSYIGCEVAASLTAMGTEVHDRDARGGGALAHVRRGGRAVGSTTCSSRTGSRCSAARSWRRSRAAGGSRRW